MIVLDLTNVCTVNICILPSLCFLAHDFVFAAHTESVGSSSDKPMKVWKMHDLGLQTLQQVRAAAATGTANTAMAKLAEVVHNFPRYASMISATKVGFLQRYFILLY